VPSAVLTEIERTGLWATDIEIWRVHYARTLAEWRKRFNAARADGRIPPTYDARFQRMWEFYLSACECVFAFGSSHVFQIQLARERDGVPLHREYIEDAERRYASREHEMMDRLDATAAAALDAPAYSGDLD
jgi:cyclopropane-fatty-acyl-phospholipid synthase